MTSRRAMLAGMAALACTACGAYDGTANGGPPHDVASLVAALRAAGATVTTGAEIRQPFFPVSGRVVVVNGEDVQVFLFADEAAARAAAATVSADGSAIGTVMVSWVGPPHFFRTGPLVSLYVGSSGSVTTALQAVMGPQFAGR